VSNNDTGALMLAQAMMADSGTLISAHFTAIPPTGTPHGITNSLSFFPTSGANFGIITTGSAAFADAPNESPNAGANLGGSNIPGRGSTAFDITTLAIDLRAPIEANCMRLDFAFYSEEFTEYVGSEFNDTFIAELNNSTWTANSTITAPDNFAFDPLGNVVSINSTGTTSMNDLNATGTTYDGATRLLQAATPISTQANTLYLSVFDQGDGIYDSAAFVDNIRFETVADPANDCRPGAQEKQVPVILLPGIGGSKLVNDNGEQWPRLQEVFDDDNGDLFLRSLRLAADGQSPFDPNDPAYATMRVGDISRVEPLFVLGQDQSYDAYGTTIEAFHNAGYEEGVSLFPFPYDWRKDATLESVRLITFIDQVRQQTGASRVDILAHSMGGLVTRAALANPNSVGKIRKVLTLGTPVLGAARGLGILEYQQPCFVDIPGVLFWKDDCLIDPVTLQELLTNFPGAYELLPSRAYDQAVNAPLNIDRDTNQDGVVEGIQPYPKWSAIVSAHRNAGLITDADTFHQTYDNLTLADPSVQYTRLIGDGLNTIRQIREYCGWGWNPWNCTVKYELVQGPGDGTVPLHSADLYNPTNGLDLRNGVTNAYAHNWSFAEIGEKSG
jgi:pimeloyl-ACP methyl ester carboxylesterase